MNIDFDLYSEDDCIDLMEHVFMLRANPEISRGEWGAEIEKWLIERADYNVSMIDDEDGPHYDLLRWRDKESHL